jgi:hypothetical protein
VHSLLRSAGWLPLLAFTCASPGCRDRVTAAQCEALLARYAELVVREKMPNAADDLVQSEKRLVREEAKSDEGFRNCTTEVGPTEFACAMVATTPDAIEKCLLE